VPHSAPPTAPPNKPTEPFVPTTPPPETISQLDPQFIKRCQQELAEFIGPIAAIICQRTLAKNSQLSTVELVEALAKQIPNPKQAQEFQRRLLS
jgi:hypothetical protein